LPNPANGIWGSNERPENTKGHYEFPYGDFQKSPSMWRARRREPRRSMPAL
jgi:hypothetical protein